MEDESMKTKYTEDQIAEAVARVAGGESRSSVARSMGMTNCANVSRWCEREERDVLRRENSLGSKEREGLRLENKRLKDRIKALLAGVTMIAVLLGCSEPPEIVCEWPDDLSGGHLSYRVVDRGDSYERVCGTEVLEVVEQAAMPEECGPMGEDVDGRWECQAGFLTYTIDGVETVEMVCECGPAPETEHPCT